MRPLSGPIAMNRAVPALFLLFGLVAGCREPADVDRLPAPSTTLDNVGRRLGRDLSPADLQRLGGDESTLVGLLNPEERDTLGRGYLRFRVDRDVIVSVAHPGVRPPFWLADQGFRPRGETIGHPDGPYRVWSRRYPAGMVGLGVNALDRRSRGHYAVFVRGENGPPVIDRIDPDEVCAVPASLGPYLDDARTFVGLPADLAASTLLRVRSDRRDAAALIRGKTWKTRLSSGPAADQVVVSFGDDPARSLAWTWRTGPSVSSSVLRIERADGSSPRVVRGTYAVERSDGLLNDPAIHRHRATIDGIEPDTTYRYAVEDGSSSGLSPWQTVRTGPVSDRDYAFLYMGDPQCGLEDWGKLLHAARDRRPDAAFLLIAGDLVDRGNERSNWDHFFHRAAGVFEDLPVMPAVGNHEYLDKGPAIFASAFALPDNGPPDLINRLAYRFEYSDCFVAVLDSNPAVYSAAMARVQADWLDDALARTMARWKVVVFHHPIYASHPTREQPQLGSAWVPVFDRHGVDLVLQGHDHAYLRTYPMRGGERNERGTVYVVSVSGTKFVPLADRPYTARGFADVATYQTIDVSPRRGTLLYRAVDLAGTELDRLELSKPSPAMVAGGASACPR